MTVKTTIGQYEYEAELLNLFDHADFGQRYSMILASGAKSPEIVEKIKQSQATEDEELRNKLNAEVGAACMININKEKQGELREMKMTALLEGKCTAKRVGEDENHKKPIYMKEAFSNHFRNSATPKEMQQVLNWILMENVQPFLG